MKKRMKPGGTYLLLVRAKNETRITVGKLGRLVVKPGYYVYLGSAHGPGGLDARVRRHLGREKKLHWHIDYLREVTVDPSAYYELDSRNECFFANELIKGPGATPLTGFGSSDCRCDSHLVYFEKMSPVEKFVTEHHLLEFPY
jgi:Uri superfamily endonuclease